MGAPSSRNCTPTTALSSVAEAATVSVPETVEPESGVVIEIVGGVVSATWAGAGRRVMAATDGTPFVSTMKSMYGPGGAVLPSTGAVTLSEPEPAVNESGTNRWFSL